MKLGHELNESQALWPSLTNELLQDIQSWAMNRSLPKVPLEQLAIFAHSCYYYKPAILHCMDVYYRMRATVPNFFKNRDPNHETLQNAMKTSHFIALPKPDKEGNRIIYHGLSDTNPSHYHFSDAIKVLLMTSDLSLYHEGCVPGHVMLLNMKGLKLGHLTRLTVSGLKNYFEYLQEAMPVRLKAIHVINCVWFVSKVLSIVRPLMNKTLFDKLHLHTGDVSEVYQYIPPECLPKDFGGELNDVETLHAENCQRLKNLRDYFLEEEKLYRGYQSDQKKPSKDSSSVARRT